MNITIRKAVGSDFPSVFSLIHGLAVFQGCPERIINSVEQMKKDQDIFQCYIAETNKKEIIGMASFFYAYYTWVGKSIFLDDLYVKEEYRGNKIGSLLLQKIVTLAKEQNCNRVRWLVSRWNEPALKFYKKIGVEVDEEALVCDLEGDRIKEFSI